MKHIFLNLKRFDVPVCYGGVNRIAPMGEWGGYIVKNTQEALKTYDPAEVEFVQYLPDEYRPRRQLRCLHHQSARLGHACHGRQGHHHRPLRGAQ